MRFSQSQLTLIIGALVLVLGVAGALYFGMRGTSDQQTRVTLTAWGILDDTNALRDAFAAAEQTFPNVRVTYQNFANLTPEAYEQKLVDALAAGTGPDIVMLHNTWLPKHYNKLAPVSDNAFTLLQMQEQFPQVVASDFAPSGVPSGITYALPFYVDTLGLFYNKDMFRAANLEEPKATEPWTWDEFSAAALRLTKKDPATGHIQVAGAAIGGSAQGINRATDLLELLMLQDGAKMVNDAFTQATFATVAHNNTLPALDALTFYTQFANPSSPAYAWDDSFRYSIDGFSEGKVGMIINYPHQTPIIKRQNPFLNFGIAQVPQRAGAAPVNYANYWGLGVANQSRSPQEAWQMILAVTMNAKTMQTYANASGHAPALLALLNLPAYQNNPELGAFVRESRTARSWPKADNVQVEASFNAMIDAVIHGKLDPLSALKKAQDEVTFLMARRKQQQ